MVQCGKMILVFPNFYQQMYVQIGTKHLGNGTRGTLKRI